MKNIIFDINILLDFLFKRDGHKKVAELFKLAAAKKIKGFVCTSTIKFKLSLSQVSVTLIEYLFTPLPFCCGNDNRDRADFAHSLH
ncbi:hypothetical protein FACS1894190_12890 [Spirochaetia bacterium]|nr:hypothetical protein FACS1894190_12890 [Spirochaetia bacterium]